MYIYIYIDLYIYIFFKLIFRQVSFSDFTTNRGSNINSEFEFSKRTYFLDCCKYSFSWWCANPAKMSEFIRGSKYRTHQGNGTMRKMFLLCVFPFVLKRYSKNKYVARHRTSQVWHKRNGAISSFSFFCDERDIHNHFVGNFLCMSHHVSFESSNQTLEIPNVTLQGRF